MNAQEGDGIYPKTATITPDKKEALAGEEIGISDREKWGAKKGKLSFLFQMTYLY